MQVESDAAQTQLSRLVERANAGDEVIITRHGRPVARLAPMGAAKPPRKLGLLAGQGHWIADDFDAPLPDHLLDLFEGKPSS